MAHPALLNAKVRLKCGSPAYPLDRNSLTETSKRLVQNSFLRPIGKAAFARPHARLLRAPFTAINLLFARQYLQSLYTPGRETTLIMQV